MKTWIAFFSILRKDMRNYYLKPPNISWGLIFPVAWTVMFFLRTETAIDVRAVLPGVIAMSILFGTTSMLAVTITFERRGRSFDRLLLAPISLTTLILAKTSGAIVFGVFNAAVPLILAGFLADLASVNWVMLAASILLIAVTSTFLGLTIAVSVREVFEAQTFSNFFRFPMLFLCGLFIPLAQLPVALRGLAYLLPLTYGADLLHTSILQEGVFSPVLSFLLLGIFTLGLFMLSMRNIQQKWIY